MTGNNRSPASVEDGCIKTALKMWYQTMMDFRVLFFCIEKKLSEPLVICYNI